MVMEVLNLLVDDIVLDGASLTGVLNSTLYEFQEPRWLSFHSEREGEKLGPMTLLKDEGATDKLDKTSIRSFGNRRLHTDGTPANPIISYKDRWTIPFYTAYAIVLPREFVATHIEFNCTEDMGWCLPLQIGLSNERLFYHTLFGEHRNRNHLFEIEVRLERDLKKHRVITSSADIVYGTNEFKHRGYAIVQRTSPEFWLKLLEIGAKLIVSQKE